MSEESKIKTTFEYCDRVTDMVYDLEDEHPKLSDDLAVEIVKAAQLVRIADRIDEINEHLDECAAHLGGLSIDGIQPRS